MHSESNLPLSGIIPKALFSPVSVQHSWSDPLENLAHNYHQTNTPGQAPLASKVCLNKSNPALGEPGTHLWKAMPQSPFPDSGLNSNVEKTN